MVSLDFHKQIFSELLEEDGILVMGVGMGLHKILLHYLKLHCDSSGLVFVLGLPKHQQRMFYEDIRMYAGNDANVILPRTLSQEYSLAER